MKLTCKCGAELEMSDDVVSMPYRMDKFLDAHACCLHSNPDNTFWLHIFASQAMQGLLSTLNNETALTPASFMLMAKESVVYATALIKELEDADGP